MVGVRVCEGANDEVIEYWRESEMRVLWWLGSDAPEKIVVELPGTGYCERATKEECDEYMSRYPSQSQVMRADRTVYACDIVSRGVTVL